MGGVPQRFEIQGDEEVRKYLKNLYESIINKDILGSTGNAFDNAVFRQIAQYVMANAGKEFSVDNIVNYYNNQNSRNKKTIARGTVYKHLEKMQRAYLIRGVKRYNIIGKEALKTKGKQYAIDMGFRMIHTNTIDFEDTFFLENVIYNELILRGYHVFTGKTYKGEVDFVAIRDGKNALYRSVICWQVKIQFKENLVHISL